MKTKNDEAANMAQSIRRGYYWVSFQPVAVCALAATGFAVFHYVFYAIAFLFSTAVYLPIAIRQYRRRKQICEKTITAYLKQTVESEE